MISSPAVSYPPTPNRSALDPYDCRPSGDPSPTYHVHPLTKPRPSPAARMSSEHIYNRHSSCVTYDDGPTRGEWVYHHASHSYESTEGDSITQPEYAAQVQPSFTDASINNTRSYNPSSFPPPHCPPPAYVESVAAWNPPYYDMDSYYDHPASIESPIDPSEDQTSYDRAHQSTSSSLRHAIHDYLIDDQPQRVNQAHVGSSNAGLHFNFPPTPDVDVTLSSSLNLSGDPAPPVSMPVFDQSGYVVDHSQSVVHSERPPLSTYSELSAHTDYYTNFLASSSTSSSRPGGKMAATTGQSQPQGATHATYTWKGRSSGIPPTPSAGPDYGNVGSAPQPPQPLQTWTPLLPPTSGSSATASHRSSHSTSTSVSTLSIKTEGREGSPSDLRPSTPPPKLESESGSPVRGMSSSRSASSDSRRSRTLSPGRTQGVLKTIMMKRGGSEPKKQNLACLFCRERKIACGRPAEGSEDQTCNQCARRSLVCQYPTESRRGQHKRSKKNNPDHSGHCVSRSK